MGSTGEAATAPTSVVAVEPDLATATATAGPAPLPARQWTAADLCVRRVLGLPVDAPKVTEASARSLAERSLLISTVRCLLTYIVLPFVLPLVHVGVGVTPVIGIVLGTVAIVANVASVRRFWAADHRYRWHYTALASVIVAMLSWLVVSDAISLI